MNFKDVELISAYLDGQTSPSDSSRLESRLASDPELAATLQALRESRGLLRQLPKRRAPRNFTLTYAMVGKKPPLPRSYSVFRFATAFAAFLFMFSFVANGASQLAASAPQYGVGGGGGGGDGNDTQLFESAPAATEAPAEPEMSMLAPTATLEPAADASRAAEEPPAAKYSGEAYGGLIPVPPTAPSFTWTIVFGVIALIGAASMFLIQRLAAKKWRSK